MKFIKKNKYTIIAIVVFIALVFLGVEVKRLLVPDDNKAAYGDRLDGIEDHPLSDGLFDKIEEKLKENTKVLKVSNTIHGKIINLTITVDKDVSVSDAKKIANSTVAMFEDKELDFYTLQVFVAKEDETLNNFPIIGYKGTTSSELKFTKDREITKEEDKTDEK